jgi:SAM-dependent methyltransferase
MDTKERDRLEYGNWVSTRLVWFPLVFAGMFAAPAILWRWFVLPAIVLLACGAYFAYARGQFSRKGADLQSKIQGLLLEAIQWDGNGRVLDIGCGSGSVAIALAKRFPAARVEGVDTWGASWEYSRELCEANARLEGVAGRTAFQRASAAALPFEDGAFDAVVSNLAFHEVQGADKRAVLGEALRVLRAGGVFAFQDLFLWRRVYGGTEAVLATARACGAEMITLIPTRDAESIPRLLRLPFMLGTLAIVKGTKRASCTQGAPSDA